MDTLQKIVDEIAALVAEKLPPGTMEKDYLDQKIDTIGANTRNAHERLDYQWRMLDERLNNAVIRLEARDTTLEELAQRVDALANGLQKLNCDIADLQRGALPDFDEMLANRIEESYKVRSALGEFIEEQIENNDNLVSSDAVREIVEDELGEHRLRGVVSDIIQNDISFEVTVS